MPSAAKPFQAVQIRPRQLFGTIENVLRIAGLPKSPALSARYFDVPLVCIVQDASGQIVREATLFLADVALQSRSITGDTVRSYGEALVRWLGHLRDLAIEAPEANEETLGVYRASLAHSEGRDRRLSGATANHRVAVACAFHTWGQMRGLMPSPLGKFLIERQGSFGFGPSGVRSRKPGKPLAPTVIRRLPRVLSAEEIRQVCLRTPQPYRLMLKWCAVSGMRRFEVCSLRLADLPNSAMLARAEDGLARLEVLRKGSREHTVHVPVSLVEETNWYVLTERPTLNGHHDEVFINSRGRPVGKAALTRAFRASADSIGCDATLHHLRHTFAVHVLKFLESRDRQEEAVNSIKTLQVLLGHANSVTTEIYLQAMDASSPSVIEALDFLYGACL